MTSGQRIGIVIHYSTSNYGNHLVNYATRSMLEECGYDVDLLVIPGQGRSKLGAFKRLPRKLLRLGIRGLTNRVLGRLQRMAEVTSVAPSDPSSERRQEKFASFSEAHLRPQHLGRGSVATLVDTYSRIGIGSDQIWNYDYGVDGSLFADFASRDKVVTLSPSVGHECIPLEWQASYEKWLTGFTEVGTRETEWTRTFSSQPEAPIFTLLVDPTLMYDVEFWRAIAAPSIDARGKLLLYHLGELLPQQSVYVTDLAECHSLDVLHLSDTVGGAAWETNAADFLGMVQEASCVVTDSYHGAIFAFLFDKPLVLLERHGFAGAMNTRTRTLTERLHLTNRYMRNLSVGDALNHDYARGVSALQGFRQEYWAYLKRHEIVRPPVTDLQTESNN